MPQKGSRNLERQNIATSPAYWNDSKDLISSMDDQMSDHILS